MDHFKDGFHNIRHVREDSTTAASHVKHETDDSGVDMALPPPIDFDRTNLDVAAEDDDDDDVELSDVKEEEDADKLADPADEWEEEEEEEEKEEQMDHKWSPKKEVQLYPEMTMEVEYGEDDHMPFDGEESPPTKRELCHREYTCRPCHFITGVHSEYRGHMIKKHGVEIGEEKRAAASSPLSEQEEEENSNESQSKLEGGKLSLSKTKSIKSEQMSKKLNFRKEKDLITKTFLIKQMDLRKKKPKMIKKANAVFHCDQCSYSDKRSSKIYAHVKKAHNTEPAKCDECGHLAGTRSILEEHVARRHADKTYNCDREDIQLCCENLTELSY